MWPARSDRVDFEPLDFLASVAYWVPFGLSSFSSILHYSVCYIVLKSICMQKVAHTWAIPIPKVTPANSVKIGFW